MKNVETKSVELSQTEYEIILADRMDLLINLRAGVECVRKDNISEEYQTLATGYGKVEYSALLVDKAIFSTWLGILKYGDADLVAHTIDNFGKLRNVFGLEY